MKLLKHRLVVKPTAVLVILSFLWSNCIYASGAFQVPESKVGVSFLGIDAKTTLMRVLPEAKALETPLVFHSELLAGKVTDLKTLVAKQDDIKRKIIREGRLKEIDLENCFSMIFKDKTTSAKAYYYFNHQGYFYRITDAEEVEKGREVKDIFYTAFLGRFASSLGEPIELNGHHIERFRVSDENLEAIDICMGELYGYKLADAVRIKASLERYNGYCERVKETWIKNLVGFNGPLTRDIVKPALDKYASDGTPKPYPGVIVISWVDQNRDKELFTKLSDLKVQIEKKMDALKQRRGLGNRLMAFVPEDSFHITLHDLITRGNYRNFYPECGSLEEAQEKCRHQVEEAFREMDGIGEIQFEVRGIGAFGANGPFLMKANVYPKTPEDLDKIERIRAKIREKTGIQLPPFSGHITLGYIISEMDEDTYRDFVNSLEEYKDIKLGSFAISEVDFSHFSNMNIYVSRIRLNTVSNEVLALDTTPGTKSHPAGMGEEKIHELKWGDNEEGGNCAIRRCNDGTFEVDYYSFMYQPGLDENSTYEYSHRGLNPYEVIAILHHYKECKSHLPIEEIKRLLRLLLGNDLSDEEMISDFEDTLARRIGIIDGARWLDGERCEYDGYEVRERIKQELQFIINVLRGTPGTKSHPAGRGVRKARKVFKIEYQYFWGGDDHFSLHVAQTHTYLIFYRPDNRCNVIVKKHYVEWSGEDEDFEEEESDSEDNYEGMSESEVIDLLEKALYRYDLQSVKIVQLKGLPESNEDLRELLGTSDVFYILICAAEELGNRKDSNAVEPLIKLLGNKYKGVRLASIEALGKIGSSSAVEPLIKLLRNEDADIHGTAAKALLDINDSNTLREKIGDDYEAILRAYIFIKEGSFSEIEKLGKSALPALISVLTVSKKNRPPHCSWYIDAVGEIGDNGAVELLIELTKDENDSYRAAAARALGKIGDPRAVEPLIELLGDNENYVREEAAEALGKIGDTRASEPLIKILEDRCKNVRAAGAKALLDINDSRIMREKFGYDYDAILRAYFFVKLINGPTGVEEVVKLGKSALPALITALEKDESWLTCCNAAKALGEIGDPSAVEALRKVLKRKNVHIHLDAAEALNKLGDSSSVEPLIRLLRNREIWVRAHAARILLNMNKKKMLREKIGDDYEAILRAHIIRHMYTTSAFGLLHGRKEEVEFCRSSLPALIIALRRNSNERICVMMVEALGMMIDDPRAVEALRKALRHKKAFVQKAARRALGNLSGTKSHPAGMGEEEENPLARELADKYPTLAGNADALDNYRFLKKILGDRLDEEIDRAARAVGVTPELVVSGVMGQDLARINGGQAFLRHLEGMDPRKGFAGIISSGGGGAFSSNMVYEMRGLAQDEKMRMMRIASREQVAEKGRYIGKNLVAVIDDGGRTGTVLRKLFDMPEWGIFVVPWGDLISVTIWGAPDDVITLVFRPDKGNVYSRININTAGAELIKGMIKGSLSSIERKKRGILDSLANHIVSNRPTGGYNVESLNRLIADYISREPGLSGDDVSDATEKIKTMVKVRIKYEGDHELSLTDIMKDFKLKKVFSELGRAFKKKELKLSPGFWFYMTNILNMSRRYDENFVRTEITPLEGISSLNAIQQGAYELSGLYQKGKDGRRARIQPDRGLQIFNVAVGSEDVYSTPISYDQATLYGVLEAASFRLTRTVEGKSVNDTFLVGEDEGTGNAYVRPIKYLYLGRLALPVTEHLVGEEARRVGEADLPIQAQNVGLDLVVKRASPGTKTEAYIDGRLVRVMHKFVIKFGSREIILGEVEGEDAKTAVVVEGRIEIVRTDATWQPVTAEVAPGKTLPLEVAPGVTLSFKSRLIITQDWVTGNNVDEPHPAPIIYISFKRRIAAINPNTATKEQLKFYFRINDRVADAIIEYRTAHPFTKVEDLMKVRGIGKKTYARIERYVILGRGGQQSYDRYIDIPEAEWPQADETALAIARQGHVFFTPKGSLFTSLTCNMLYPGFVRVLVSRSNLTRVFIGKYKRDVEAAGLTLSEQLQALIRSVQRVGAGGVLREGDRLYRYIFIPRVADRIRDQIIKERAKKAESIRKKIAMGDTSAKVSKVPTDVQLVIVNINEADRTTLMLLPHITEGTADLIIEYRNTHGRFRTKDKIEGIPEVRALGQDLLETIKSCIILEGDDDLAYFRRQGIIPIIIYNEKKEGYDELQILDLLTFTGERDTLLSLLHSARQEGVEGREPTLEFRNGESFWGVTWWDSIFGLTEGEEITATLDDRYSFKLKVPESLDEGQLYIAAYYLALYIYNRMKAIGAKHVNLSCRGVLFNKVKAVLDNSFYFERAGYTLTNNTGQAVRGRLETDSLSLNVGRSNIELTYIDSEGNTVKTNPSDMVIDMALQAARHEETQVHGAVNQYITQEGVVRIARRILTGNLRNSDVEEDLNKLLVELLSDYLNESGRINGTGLTPKEFYALFDFAERLEEDKGIDEFIDDVNGIDRAGEILGIDTGRLNYENLSEITERVNQLVSTHSQLASGIVNRTADGFIKKVKGYYEEFGMNTLLLSSSKMCLGTVLGRRLGEALTARLGGMPIDICLEDELSYDMVYRKFLENDPTAVEVFRIVGRYLAVTIEELYNIFGVKKVCISGTPYDNGPGGDFIIGEARKILGQKGVNVEIVRGLERASTDRRVEALTKTYNALMLDIDGVLRNFGRMKVVPDRLIRKICSLVNDRAIPVVINSVRDLESQNEVLLDKLKSYLEPELHQYVSTYYVRDGKLYLFNLGTGETQYVKDLPAFEDAQIIGAEGVVRDVAQRSGIEVKGVIRDTSRGKITVKLRDHRQVENFVNLINAAFRKRGIVYAKALNSGVYCEIMPAGYDAKKDALLHYASLTGIPIAQMARIGDQVHRNSVDFGFANLSTDRVDPDGEAVGIDLRNTDATDWYLKNLTFVSTEAEIIKEVNTLIKKQMPLSAIYVLSSTPEGSPYYEAWKNIMGRIYSSDVVSELLDKIKELKRLAGAQDVEILRSFVAKIDNTFVNPERINWFIGDILEDIRNNGTPFVQALNNAQRRLYVGPQEMWAYLLSIVSIVDGRPVVFVARNEELQNAWQDMTAVARGLGRDMQSKSYLVKLSRKDTLGSQINAVLRTQELAEPVSGDLWNRLDAAYQSLSGENKELVDAKLGTMGVSTGWSGINGMARGKVISLLADIGIDENIVAYWNNYREIRKVRNTFRHALRVGEVEDMRRIAGQWKECNRRLLNHIQSLSNLYGIAVPEIDTINSLVSDFSRLVSEEGSLETMESVGSEIYSAWLRSVNLVFNSVSAEMLMHVSRPLLNVLLEDTTFCRDIRNGVVFVDDITTGGRTMFMSKFFAQAFRKGVNSEFIPIVKRNKIPEGHHYYVSQIVRLPEDSPDMSNIVYYEEKTMEGIPVLMPVLLDELSPSDYAIPTAEDLQKYDEFLNGEVGLVKVQLPHITLPDRVIKQVIKNCLTGVSEKDSKSVYGLMVENYYSPLAVQYERLQQYNYEISEVFRFYSDRVDELRREESGRGLISLAQKIKPYEENKIAKEWKKQAEIYRAKQAEAVTKVQDSRDVQRMVTDLIRSYEMFKQKSLNLGREVTDSNLSVDQIAQSGIFTELMRLHKAISENFSGLLGTVRDQFKILNTQIVDSPDVLPEGSFASESDISRVLNTFGIQTADELTVRDIEELIREYNKALALIQLYLNQRGVCDVSARLKSLLVPPRVSITVQPGVKSHPAGIEDITHLIDNIITRNVFQWDREQLRQYYIPLAQEIISRQKELGRRYVVGISGPGGVGKTDFAERLREVLTVILGEGKVGVMHQDGYFYDLSEVENIRQELAAQGDRRISQNRGSPRYLNIPYMLEQIRSFMTRGRFQHPVIERTREIRRRIRVEEKQAEDILLVEGHYLFTKDSYNSKYTPDDEWAAHFRSLYDILNLHLYIDADLGLIKQWKTTRPTESAGRTPEELDVKWQTKYKLHALKSKEDRVNADIVIEKGDGHVVKKIYWDEAYERGSIRERFGKFPERRRTIHIVGPAASGKTTTGEHIGEQLGCVVFNTGDIFRPYTYKAITTFKWLRDIVPSGDIVLTESRERGRILVNAVDESGKVLRAVDITERFTNELLNLINTTQIEYEIQGFKVRVKVDGVDVTSRLHDQVVEDYIDVVSKIGLGIEKSTPSNSCRAMMKLKARPIKEKLEQMPLIVTTGRGFKGDAICWIFLNAIPGVRARRACIRIGKKPYGEDLTRMEESLRKRDDHDRIFVLLQNYQEVYFHLDSTWITIEDQKHRVFEYVCKELEKYREERREQEEILDLIIKDRQQDRDGTLSFIVLKGGDIGGVNTDIRRKILDVLGNDFEVCAGKAKRQDMQKIFMRWKIALERFVRSLYGEDFFKVNEEDTEEERERAKKRRAKLDSLMKALQENDPWKFRRTLGDISDDLRDSGISLRRFQRLRMLFQYVKDNDTQLIVLKRKRSRMDILRSRHISIELARELLGGKNPFEVDEQDFVKAIIVGPTAPHKALPSMLRHIVYKEFTGGLLRPILSEGRSRGLDDETTMSICNGVHAPGVEELALEIGLIDLEDAEDVLNFIRRVREARPPSSFLPEGRPVLGSDVSRYYEVRPSLPIKEFSNGEIRDLLQRETGRLVSNLDTSTFEGAMQYWLLRQRLNFMINSINAVSQPISEAEELGFYDTLIAMTHLIPFIVEQVPQDGYRNIYLARDSGILYMAYNLINRITGRDDRDNYVFHLSRKNIGSSVYSQMRIIVKKASFRNPSSLEEYMNIIMPDFVDLMARDKGFRKKAKEVYSQLIDAGIVGDGNDRFRVVDVWSGGRLATYLMAVIKFFDEYDIDDEGKVTKKSGKVRQVFAQFIVKPKDEFIRRLSQVFNFDQTGLTQEVVEGWYQMVGRECRFANEEVFIKVLGQISTQVFTRHYPYGELNLGHRIDWNPLKQKLAYASPPKQLGAFLREVMIVNSVLHYMEFRKIGQIVKAIQPATKSHPAGKGEGEEQDLDGMKVQGLDLNITPNDFLRHLGITLTDEESALYEEWVSIFNEHYVTESDMNQINILVNTAHLIKIAGAEVIRFMMDNSGLDLQYNLAIQKLIDAIKQINYFHFVNVFNSILLTEGTKGKGLELLEHCPGEVAVIVEEAAMVWHKEVFLQDELLILSRTQKGLEGIIADGEFDNLIRASNKKYTGDVTNTAKMIETFPRRSAIVWFGPSGSGKTALARAVAKELEQRGRSVLTLLLDHYYKRTDLPRSPNGYVNLDTPEAIDWDKVREHLRALLDGERVEILRSKSRHPRVEGVQMEDILFIDGLYANSENIMSILRELNVPNLTISVICIPCYESTIGRYLTSYDSRRLRRISRDLSKGKSLDDILKRLETVKSGEKKYILLHLRQADTIVNTFQPYNICFLKSILEGRVYVRDESLREEVKNLEDVMGLIPVLNSNIARWRKQLEDAKRLLVSLSGETRPEPIDLESFDMDANLIKEALFYNNYPDILLEMLKSGVRSDNIYLRIISAYVLVDIGDDSLVTREERYKYLDILLTAVEKRELPRDDSLRDRIDFHVHSYYSDGFRSVTGLVFEAWFRGMRAIAITDHNTFDHMGEVIEAREIIRKVDMRFEVIPGVEINVSDPNYGSGSEHLLAYFPINSTIKGREDRVAFLEWLDMVRSSPFIDEIKRCDLWDENAYEYRFGQLRDIVENKRIDIGIPAKYLDLSRRDFVGLFPRRKFVSLVSYALHRKYGLSMEVINKAMERVRFDRKDIPGNEELRARGYSGVHIRQALEFLRQINGVVFVAHPRYTVLKKSDLTGLDKSTPKGRAARMDLKMTKMGAYFTEYREYLDGIEVYYPEHEDDLILALQGFIHSQNIQRDERHKIIFNWGTDYHSRPGEMATARTINSSRLAEGFEEGRAGHIHSSVGSNYHVVRQIIERASQKSSQPVPLTGAKSHPSGALDEARTTKQGYLIEYEGITYSDGKFQVKTGVSGNALRLNELLNMALELIQDVAPRRGPPIYVHVKPIHTANVTKDIDTRGRVHLIFDERFIKYFVDQEVIESYPESIRKTLPQVAQWIIAERSGHELSHDNRIGASEKERLEEISVLRDFDVPFYRRLLQNPQLKAQVDTFFRVVRPRFRSGHFYGMPEDFPDNRWINGVPRKGFLGYAAQLDPKEVPAAVERYVDAFYNFGIRKSHPAGMISDEEIRRILALPTDFRASSEVNDVYKNLSEFREVKIVFDCGKSIIREYTVKIPISGEVTDDIIDYVALFIYNRLGEIGAQRVYVEDEQIRRAIDERYNIDDKSRPRDRAYLKMRKNLRRVYGREFEFALIRPQGTTVVEKGPFSFDKDRGEVIGIDIGKSDIKVVAMKEGAVTYYYKEDWNPGEFESASDHIGVIQRLVERAKQEGGLTRLDTIGLSVNLVVMNGLVVGKGPMNKGLKDKAEEKKIKELGKERSDIFKVPVSVLNDGDASAIWACESMGLKRVLGLSFGSGLAAGYGDRSGDVIDLHGEMGNVVIDIGPNAAGHSATHMPGASQQYLSQRAVFRLAERRGLDLDNIPGALVESLGVEYDGKGNPKDASKLRYAQYLLENGTDAEKQTMEEIFVELGRYLAAAIAEVTDYLEIETVILFGRVTIGRGGEIIKRAAEIILEQRYPNLRVNIQLPKEPPQDKPVDFYREFAQAIGAAYFANKEKQRVESATIQPGTKSHPAGRDEIEQLVISKLDQLASGKNKAMQMRLYGEKDGLIALGLLIGSDRLVKVFELMEFVNEYDYTQSKGFAETIIDLFNLVQVTYPTEDGQKAKEFADRLPQLIAQFGTPENVWTVLNAAHEFRELGGEEYLDVVGGKTHEDRFNLTLDTRNLFVPTIPSEDRFVEGDFSSLKERIEEIKKKLLEDIEKAKTEKGRKVLIKSWREWLVPWLAGTEGTVDNPLDYEYWMDNNSVIKKIIETAEKVRNDSTEAFVHVGIGGSIIPTKAIVNPVIPSTINQISKTRRGDSPQVYYTGDSFSPELVTELLNALEDQGILFKTKFNVISKSGTTAETIGTYLVIRARLQMRLEELKERYDRDEITDVDLKKLGLVKDDITPIVIYDKPYFKTGRFFIATTGFDKKSVLYSQFHHRGRTDRGLDSLQGEACYQGTDIDPFYAILPVPEGMGGRFSGFSSVGLLLLAVTANSNIGETPHSRVKEAFKGIRQALDRVINKPADSRDNVAFMTAAISHIAEYIKKKSIEVLYFFDPRLADTAKLLDELYSESLQEFGRGIDVRPLIGTVDNHMAWNGIIAGPRNKIIRFVMTAGYEKQSNPFIPIGSGITGDVQAIEGLSLGEVQKQATLGTAEDAVWPRRFDKEGKVVEEKPGVLNYTQILGSKTVANVADLVFTMMLETAILGKLNCLEVETKEDGTVVDLTYLQDWVEGYKKGMRERCGNLKIKQDASGEAQGSHLVRVAVEGEEIVIKSDEEVKPYNEMLEFALGRLRHIYGSGIFTRTREIWIVENLNEKGLYPEGRAPLASFNPGNGILKIDKKLFEYGKWVLFEELEHEHLESIGDIIPGCSRAVSDVVSTFINVLRFLNPNMGVAEEKYMVDVEEYRNEILKALKDEELDPDGEYLALLRGLLKLERKGRLSEDIIVASVVGYVMRTKVYEKVRDELGLPRELAIIIKLFYPLFEDALSVFGEIKDAKRGKELIEKVKETKELAISVVKTFTGVVRIRGLEKFSNRFARIVSGSVKVAGKLEEIASLQPAMTGDRYCIVLDKDRIPDELRDDWERRIRELESNGMFEVVYSLEEAQEKGFKGKRIIHLVAPGDLKEEMPEGILYLPMPYLRSSLYMAVHIVMAGGVLDKVNPLVKGLILDLYREIFSGEVTDEDLWNLFNAPWKILPKIADILMDLNNLNRALAEIEKAV